MQAAPDDHGISAVGRGGGSSWRRTIGRVVLLAAFAVSLYLVAPGLLALFGTIPQLRDVFPVWFLAVAVLEALAFASIWELTRIALKTRAWFDVVCSQLAGNALSRALPGGAATGGALQLQMLTRAGFDPATTTTALTAVGLLSTATLFVLPVVAIVPIIFGLAVDSRLIRGAILAAAIGALLIAGGSVLLTSDRVMRGFGNFIDTLIRRYRALRHQPVPTESMADRVVDARNFVRDALSSSWKRALPAALGKQLFDFLALYASLLAVGAYPDPTLVLLAYVAGAALAMVPITPGGLGFVEAGLTGVLALAGVSPDHAVLAVLLYRLFSYWLPLPAGVIASTAFSHRHRSPPPGQATTA
ncbi:MAG: lysylphosphatidylglycerol synthase transmembrane domain-containing protein [Acidimicrobiia bacterium]